MRIGKFEFSNPVILAPMAGVTDMPFRCLCSHYGADITYSEMISSNQRVWETEKAQLRTMHHSSIGINAIQIAGSNPKEMAHTAIACADIGADIIDINMGCPAKKINRQLAGSALMRDIKLVQEILSAVVKSVNIPVTLKMRTGWDKTTRNCVEIAKIAEDIGVQALTIHGRTRNCMYKGNAEYDFIKAVKQAVSIPVIANGDITSANKAKFVLDYTNADAVMIGRAILGQPWLLKQIKFFLETGVLLPQPSTAEKTKKMLEHILALHRFYGDYKGVRIARKHIGWYLDHLVLPNHIVKPAFNLLTEAKEQLIALENFFNSI